MVLTKSVLKYLQSYAEPEAKIGLSAFNDALTKEQTFNHVLVIPAYKETPEFLQRFAQSDIAQQGVLLITVINQPEGCLDNAPQRALYQQAQKLGDVVFENQQLCLVSIANQSLQSKTNSMILLVNRFDVPIAVDKGVGLARKIGVDIAVQLIASGWVNDRWVYSSDADAHLPNGYFDHLRALSQRHVAACFDFFHHSEDHRVHLANQQYELALRYYVAGLAYANSRYAFFTIGSTLAFDHNAYCMARGFPTRAAGEDFYLLNKVAKLGDVAFIDAVQIKIDARTSDRVPFGTGPAVSKILSIEEQQQAYCYYHPQVFVELKNFLAHWHSLYCHRDDLTPWLLQLSASAQKSLELIGFATFIAKQKKNTQKQFEKQLDTWFDAFKTLKFIHHIRDDHFADMPLIDAIDCAPFKINV